MTPEGVREAFEGKAFAKVAMEAGAQSGWVTRALRQLGYEPIVANPRKLKAFSANERKSDRNDAHLLAKLATADATLLHPVHHRSAAREHAMAVMHARDALVRERSRLIGQIRSMCKGVGARLKSGGADAFVHREPDVPTELEAANGGLFAVIRVLNEQITAYDHAFEAMIETSFPEARRVRQVRGVGPVTALAFVLALEDPARFRDGRTAAAFLGLVPRRDQSGAIDKQLGISKTGNDFVRRLLVQCAHYILGPLGHDCDLRRWGHALMERGGKSSKKRAIVATARKLAVLLFTTPGRRWDAPQTPPGRWSRRAPPDVDGRPPARQRAAGTDQLGRAETPYAPRSLPFSTLQPVGEVTHSELTETPTEIPSPEVLFATATLAAPVPQDPVKVAEIIGQLTDADIARTGLQGVLIMAVRGVTSERFMVSGHLACPVDDVIRTIALQGEIDAIALIFPGVANVDGVDTRALVTLVEVKDGRRGQRVVPIAWRPDGRIEAPCAWTRAMPMTEPAQRAVGGWDHAGGVGGEASPRQGDGRSLVSFVRIGLRPIAADAWPDGGSPIAGHPHRKGSAASPPPDFASTSLATGANVARRTRRGRGRDGGTACPSSP